MFKRTHVDLLLVRTELSLGVEEEKHGVGRNADRLFTVGVLNFHLDSRPLDSLGGEIFLVSQTYEAT